MSPKRPLHSSTEDRLTSKKARKGGFSVGPQNLPDGTHKRKVDKIRRKLVENAKIKKSYDRLKAKEKNLPEGAIEQQRHPERQALIDGEDEGEEEVEEDEDTPRRATGRPVRRQKQPLFRGDVKIAEARKREWDKKREDMATARVERDKRLAERERWRRTMANARGDGRRRKLGKESTVLLEKVRRMVEG